MKGFPLQNLFIMLLALAGLAVPLLRVDQPTPAAAAAVPEALSAHPVPVLLRMRFVHLPDKVELTMNGQPIPLRGAGLEREGETALGTEPDAAMELDFKAAWPPGTPATMVEVRAAPDGKPEQAQNVWTEAGAADELLRFTWRDQP